MVTDRSFLNRHCSTDPLRTKILAPIGILGRPGYDAATDGHHLVAVAPRTLPTVPFSKSAKEVFDSVPPGTLPVSLAALRAWAEPPIWPSQIPYPECKGGPKKRKRASCDECEGDGTVAADNMRAGLLGVCTVDRNLVARALDEAFTDETILIGIRAILDPISFDGDGWRAIVMPMKCADDESAGAPRLVLPKER